jgi:hypothetical protein
MSVRKPCFAILNMDINHDSKSRFPFPVLKALIYSMRYATSRKADPTTKFMRWATMCW